MIVALAGSGEFLRDMEGVDSELLRLAPGPRVAILPTAAGLEDPDGWGQIGVAHFERLGADARHVRLHRREDAYDPRVLSELELSDLFYLSGGHPDHLVETLEGTPAWTAITGRIHAGAVIAGCSAGATALGGWSISIRAAPWRWRRGLGLLPGWAVLPHYDVPPPRPQGVAELIAALPDGAEAVGIDEDTVLFWDGRGWQVRGAHQVTRVRAGRDAFTPVPV